MRLLVVATALLRGETQLLRGLQQQGVDVHVICDPDHCDIGKLEDAGVTAYPLAITKRIQRNLIRRIRELLSGGEFDVIYVIQKRALSNARLALIGRPEKLVAYRGIIGNLSYLDPMSWLTFLSPRVDRIICVAEAIRRYFLNLKFLGFGMRPDKFVTIRKGHDVGWYEWDEPFDMLSVGVPAGETVIGCVAAMRPRKGVAYLIEAFDQLDQSSPKHLVLVGKITDKSVSDAIGQSPVGDRIHALGYRSDAAQIIGSFDLFVLPSIRREGLPRSVMEGMCQGVPAIVTDSGGSPELIVEDENGMVVPPADAEALAAAIEEMLSDRDRLKAMGANARRHMETNVNIATTVDETRALFEELVQSG